MRLFSVDQRDIIIETVKLAEDRSEDIILRLYQSTGATTVCNLNTVFPLEKAWKQICWRKQKEKLILSKNVFS